MLLLGCAPATSTTTANNGNGLPTELAFCRASPTSTNTAELALRTARNLGTARIAERSGRELQVRVHPDGDRLAFVRQSTPSNSTTSDLYVAWRTGAAPETRLTIEPGADENPCWSPDGNTLLFSTARAGDRRLWTCGANGLNPQPFLAADPGVEDTEADWSRTTDRIVFVRRQAGSSRLFLVNGNGTGLAPLGGARSATTANLGVHEPCFTPDGNSVAFVDVTATGFSRLWSIDSASGVESLLFDPQGEVRMPRYAPTADRIVCGIAQPGQGRQGLRLSMLDAGGTNPRLIEPGENWVLHGVDVFPAMVQAPVEALTETLPLSSLQLQLSAGAVTQGGKNQLASEDNQSMVIATDTFLDHEIAGINCRYTLPGATPGEIVAIRARITARVSRSDANTTLRTSLFNPVGERFDTVAEVVNPGTGMRTLTFTTQSLAHVTLERQVRVTVIGEIGAGARAEMAVDQVQLDVVRSPVLRERQ